MRYNDFKIVEDKPLTESAGTTKVTVGDQVYQVGNDLIKQGGVYAIFSGDSARAYAQANGLVVPPRAVLQKVYANGKKLEMPTRPNNPTDTNAKAHHEQIIEKNGNIPGGLVYGHKKEICEGPGTRLFGGIVNGRLLQRGGKSQHGGGYVDYSQGLRACKLVEGGNDPAANNKSSETKTQKTGKVYIIGDSHAKAIPGANNLAANGATIAQTQAQAKRVPDNSIVLLSAGHNDVAGGKSGDQVATALLILIDSMTSRGIKVNYVLFPEGTRNPNQENMAPTRQAIQSRIGVYYDLDGKGLSNDGKHAVLSAYRQIPMPTGGSTNDAKSKDITKPVEKGETARELKAGPPYPPSEIKAVAAMQRKLEDLGYSVGSTGVDGKYGPRTAQAVKAFKADYKMDGSEFAMDTPALDTLDGVIGGTVARVAKPTKVTRISGKLGKIAQDSVTQGKVGRVLDLIAGPESGGRYEMVYPGTRRPQILDMTLDELFQDMRSRGRASGSSASGRYQYIQSTLRSIVNKMGLDTATTKFTPEIQDEIAIYHLRLSHGLDRWLAGQMRNEQFLDRISKTWAGIPNPSTGRSYYAGVLDNKAGLAVNTALNMLLDIQQA